MFAAPNEKSTDKPKKNEKIWDLETMQCIKIIRGHDNTVCSLATFNNILFSGSFTEVKAWDLETYECIQTLTGHNHWFVLYFDF